MNSSSPALQAKHSGINILYIFLFEIPAEKKKTGIARYQICDIAYFYHFPPLGTDGLLFPDGIDFT